MRAHRFLLTAALASAAAAVAAPAAASVTITSITGNPGFLTGQVKYSPGGIGGSPSNTVQNLNIGRIRLAGTDTATMQAVTFDAYCIDIFHYVQNGSFDLQAFSLANPTKQAQIGKLLGHTAGFIDAAGNATAKKNISAAIQMAVWEIVNEGGISGYSLDNGLFQIANNYGSVVGTSRTLAQGYLNDMAGWSQPTGYRYRMMTALNPVSNQRQVFLAAVPEPSTWALLIGGFGVIGGAMRRRRARTTIAFV